MVRNLMLIFGLSLAVAAFGCDSESTDKGDAGTGGTGAGGSGAGGSGGDSVAPACDNTDDLAALAAGEPQMTLATDCVTANLPIGGVTEMQCAEGAAACLLDGNDGATDPTTLSAECTSCTTALACCITAQCSALATPPGTCVGSSGDATCNACIADKCTPAHESCGEGTGGTGGSGAGGSGAGGTSS